MKPRISIIFPYKNEAETIRFSLDSILRQTFTDWELIAIDDGSTDNSKSIVDSYSEKDSRIISISCGISIGLPAVLNIGIFCASADLIARADADDINLVNRLQIQYEYMNNNLEVDVLGSGAVLIDALGNKSKTIILPSKHIELCKFELNNAKFFHSSVIIRRRFFNVNGVYDTFCPRAQDKELWLRGLKNGALYANIPKPLIEYATRGYIKSWKTIMMQFKSNIYINRKYNINYGLFYVFVELARSVAIKLRLFNSGSLK